MDMSALAARLSGGRVSHAVLIEGRGEKLGFARTVAKMALCSSEKDKPCGVCRDCVKIEKSIHPDLIIYTGGDRSRSLHVDAVRDVRQEAYIRPNEASGKVFILDNAHNMTIQAQNALLKIIEEPPSGVTFILTCENKSLLLETLLSRLSVFTLDELPPAGDRDDETQLKARRVLEMLFSGNELEVLAALAPYERDRSGFAVFLNSLREAAADDMLEKAKSPAGLRNLDRLRLLRIIDIIDDMERASVQNVSGLLLVTILSAKFNL